jgi:hypothetical protein
MAVNGNGLTFRVETSTYEYTELSRPVLKLRSPMAQLQCAGLRVDFSLGKVKKSRISASELGKQA